MKNFLLALLVLALTVAAVAVNAFFISRSIEAVTETVSALPMPTPPENPSKANLSLQAFAVEEAEKEWKEKLKWISVSVNHSDVMAVSEQFALLNGAAKAGDYNAYLISLSGLGNALDHLSELASLRLTDIL